MNKDNAIGFSIGLLAGAVIGGIVAVLYAPKTGKETRQLIKDTAMETREKAADVAEHVKDFATETVDKVKDATSEANRKGQAAIHALKS